MPGQNVVKESGWRMVGRGGRSALGQGSTWLCGRYSRAVTALTQTQSMESDAAPAVVYELLADPRHIPEWAPDFADLITGDAHRGWRAVKHGEDFALEVVPQRDARTVDYLREIAPGRTGGAYARVLPRPAGGSVIVMTLPLPPGTDPAAVAATLHRELAALSRLATQG